MSTPALVPRCPGLSLPAEHRVGDALSFEVQSGLPAGWFVFFVLDGIVGNTPVRFLLGRDVLGTNTVAVDQNGVAAFLAVSTAGWAAGRFDWVGFSVDPQGNRAELARGTMRLLPDVAGATPVDGRTFNQKCLDSIRAVIAGTVTDDTFMFKIGTRELTKISRKELMTQEAIFESRVRREQGKGRRRRGPAVQFGGSCS